MIEKAVASGLGLCDEKGLASGLGLEEAAVTSHAAHTRQKGIRTHRIAYPHPNTRGWRHIEGLRLHIVLPSFLHDVEISVLIARPPVFAATTASGGRGCPDACGCRVASEGLCRLIGILAADGLSEQVRYFLARGFDHDVW